MKAWSLAELVRSFQGKKQRSQVGKLNGTAFWCSSVIENLQKIHLEA
jgi:hypothetical protein